MQRAAKFNIGDVVVHKQHGYRAVVVDIDPLFQASGRLNPQAEKREFSKRNPWYRLLVDESNQMTYVEECDLFVDQNQEFIDNPQVHYFLKKNPKGYRSNAKKH